VRQEPAPAVAPPPPPTYEDAALIEKGIGYEELLRRFGSPALKISGMSTLTMSYLTKSGPVQVELEDGKVVSVTRAGA
jgi:hypothetical protein